MSPLKYSVQISIQDFQVRLTILFWTLEIVKCLQVYSFCTATEAARGDFLEGVCGGEMKYQEKLLVWTFWISKSDTVYHPEGSHSPARNYGHIDDKHHDVRSCDLTWSQPISWVNTAHIRLGMEPCCWLSIPQHRPVPRQQHQLLSKQNVKNLSAAHSVVSEDRS